MIKKICLMFSLFCCLAAHAQVVKYSFNGTLAPNAPYTDQLTPVSSPANNAFYDFSIAGPTGFGSALNITAAGGNLQYFNMAQLYDFPQRTVCFWFKPAAVNGSSAYIYMTDGPTIQNSEAAMQVKPGNIFSFLMGVSINATTAYIPGQWNFAAITRSAADIRYYLNCQLVATVPLNNATATSASEQYQPFSRIGNLNEISPIAPAPMYQYTGGIDEFAIYNTALSESDLQTLMGAGGSEQLFPQVNGPETFCSGAPVTMNGFGSYGAPFNTVNSCWWSLQQCYSNGHIIPGSQEYGGWFPGPPGSHTFPPISYGVPTYTCGNYYLVRLGMLNSCAWASSGKVIYIDCPPSFSAGSNKNLCPGAPVTIGNPYNDFTVVNNIPVPNPPSSFYTFQWSPSTWLSNAASSNPTVTIPSGYSVPCPTSTVYTVTTTDGYGCTASSQATVNYATQATVPTITQSGPGISGACSNNSQNCSNLVTLSASTSCSTPVTYNWWSTNSSSSASSFVVFPTAFTYYGLNTTNICYTSTSWPSVMPCYHPTGAFPLFGIDNVVYVDWSGNSPASGFHIYDNTVPVGSTPAYNSDMIEVWVADRFGVIAYHNIFCSTSCWGFWNGQVYWNPIYHGQPLPNDTYAFKVVMTNCNTNNTNSPLSGFFDVIGTRSVTKEDGTQELQADVRNIRSDSQGLTVIKSAKEEEFAVYPNPANDILHIETKDAAEQTVKMYDMAGRLVLSQQMNGKTTLNTGDLKNGVYGISISGANGTINRKVVIAR